MTIFECSKCGKVFKRKANKDYHEANNACKDAKYACKHCDRKFTTKTNMYRHIRTSCREKETKDKEDKETTTMASDENEQLDVAKIYDMLLKLKEEHNELREENDVLKIKVKEMEKEPKVVNNTTNNINNGSINNGTVNNIYLVGYGKEDMSKIDRDDLLGGIRMGFNSTLKLIDTVHFNPKYPEFHNVYISSMKNKYAMMYDGSAWTLVMKDDLIDKMYDDKRDYIEDNLEDFLKSLTVSQTNAMHRWLNADDDHHYVKKIKNDIKLLLYNKRDLAKSIKNRTVVSNIDDTKKDNRCKDKIADKNIPRVIKTPKIMPKSNHTPKNNSVKSKFKLRVAPRNGAKRKVLNRNSI